jgi:hypothetical protein
MHWLDAASIWRSNLSLDLRRPLRYAKRNHSTFGCCETKRILKRKGNTLVEAFAGVIPDGARPPGRQPNLMFNADGTIRYRSPYTKNAKEKLLRWNESQHRFLP